MWRDLFKKDLTEAEGTAEDAADRIKRKRQIRAADATMYGVDIREKKSALLEGSADTIGSEHHLRCGIRKYYQHHSEKHWSTMTSQVYMMRLFTPLWVGMLTFINPWMILLMNQEVRRMTLGKHMSEDSSSVHPAVASQQFTRTATKKPTLYEKE
ncbi:unnamed protein product [Haemonchus placei]|uniref:Uncharacterized protein n=1 Tax=Haemonchus placei TaxID=6290 RepID=A0A158QKI1_HAEPC|nr:unnamed protein product [Haemonchus placei]